MKKLTRTITPQVKVIDAARGICNYVASNQTIDSYNEVIMATGWRFTDFAKNSPFVDSHNYSTISQLVGKVIDFRVEGSDLIETVQWAIDVPENTLAQLGWKMTVAGYLKAVSVGFMPTRTVNRWDADPKGYQDACKQLGLTDPATAPRTIYLEQEQLELSACIIGANPDALACARSLGFSEAEINKLSCEERSEPAPATDESALVVWAREQTQRSFLEKLNPKQ
jgi:hypothetical protein